MPDILTFAQPADGAPITASGVVYSGKPMTLYGTRYAVDLAASMWAEDGVPLLRDHRNETTHRLGLAKPRVENGALFAEVEILDDSPAAAALVAQGKKHPWQTSIGLKIVTRKWLEAGEAATVNGQDIAGPAVVVAGELTEISVVPVGADRDAANRLHIAASADADPDIITLGGVEADLNALATTKDRSMKMPDQPQNAAPPTPPAPNAPQVDVEAVRAAERERIQAIRATAAGHDEIIAKAIDENWTDGQTAKAVLAAIKASAEKPPAPELLIPKREQPKANVLSASLSLSLGVDEKLLLKDFGEQTLAAADKLGRISLWEVCCLAAAAEGVDIGHVKNSDAIRAAFSTTSLSGILGTAANKVLQASYAARPSIASAICNTHFVSDFKTFSMYRFLGAGELQEVGPDGEIPAAELQEESSTNKVGTYGTLVRVTRQTILNDDLDALGQVPAQFGAQATRKMDDLLVRRILANAGSFFHANNGNLATGAATAMSTTSFGTAIKMLAEQTGIGGELLNLDPRYVLFPAGLEQTARELVSSGTIVVAGATDAVRGSRNVLADYALMPMRLAGLGLSSYSGYSTTAWYLLADPMICPAIDLAFLRQTGGRPVIESSNTDFATLGFQWRIYHDFGVALNDHRGAVKMAGV